MVVENIKYEVIRSRRRTISLSISRQGEIVVRAPLAMPEKAVGEFVEKHSGWIEKNLSRMREAGQNRIELTEADIERLRTEAGQYMKERTFYFADIMGVEPREIKITLARSRWGSCSARNTVCYSYKVMLLPKELIDYIIVHELAHITEKNHSKKFYDIIAGFMPDYRERESKIKEITPEIP